MASAVLIDVADAVVADLNAATLSQPVTAARLYLPQFDLKEMTTLHVSVVPKAETIAAASRASTQHDYAIDVGVQKKLAAGDNAEIDPLMLLAQEIADYFRFRPLTGRTERWVRTEVKAPYSPEHLDQLRQFTSVVTLVFRGARN
jgi:DNA-binding XRE family transcriptional regulator